MRYALIIAGGSGTRLWPMSRAALPKQLLPFIGGKSLLQLAFERLEGLVPVENRIVCAGKAHEQVIREALHLSEAQFLGEPTGRDTLNAVGYGAAVIAKRDPQAAIAVFTADHIIEPLERFRAIVERGFQLVEEGGAENRRLVTFGITPTQAATGYGYLELGEPISGEARVVRQFKEKPDAATAQSYFEAGPQRYLWNSGMFVWRADTLLDCIARYEPANAAGLEEIAAAWESPRREEVLAQTFPALKKISVDFAVMEPASRDEKVQVAALPMPLKWLDVGSWPMFGETCARDEAANAHSGRALFLESRRNLAASSDPGHLIATVGCEDLIIIHTPDATLVCHKEHAEGIKALHQKVGERFGKELL